MTSTKGHRFGKSEGTAHSDIMAEKMNDKNQFNGVEQDEGEGEDGGCGNFGSSIAESEPASPLRRVTIDEGAIRESAEAVVDTVQLTILEENELVGEVAFMESSALGERFVAGGEGCAMRMISREAFLAELRRDPEFAGNVFKNLALTLSVKCEEINWRLEEMATEASSMSWRASWRIDSNSTHKQQYAVSASEAKKLRQLFEIPDEEDLSHSTTATFGYNSVRVNGHFLAFAKHLCFYSRVFGMQVPSLFLASAQIATSGINPEQRGPSSNATPSLGPSYSGHPGLTTIPSLASSPTLTPSPAPTTRNVGPTITHITTYMQPYFYSQLRQRIPLAPAWSPPRTLKICLIPLAPALSSPAPLLRCASASRPSLSCRCCATPPPPRAWRTPLRWPRLTRP
jgi:hypothetical protein